MQRTVLRVTTLAEQGIAPLVPPLIVAFGEFKDLVGAMANVVKPIGFLAVLAYLLIPAGCSEDSVPSRANPLGQIKSIEWVDLSFEEAKALSVADGKFLLVSIAEQWCPYSARMDSETWVDPSVIAWVQNKAVALRWDLGGDTWMPIEIRGVPTTVVYSGENEVARHEGFLVAPEFVAWLESIESGKGRRFR